MKNKIVKSLFYNIDNIAVALCFSLIYLQHICIMLKANSFASKMFTILFVIVVLWFAFCVARDLIFMKKKPEDFKLKSKIIPLILCASVLLFSLFAVLIDVLANTKSIPLNFDYYRKLLIFMEVVFFLYSCYSGFFSKLTVNILLSENLFFSLITILLFLIGKTRTWHGFVPGNLLSLNFANSNTAGIVLCINISLIFYTIVVVKKIYFKLPLIPVLVFLIVLLYMTKCRNAYLATFLFVICLFVAPKLFNLNKTFSILFVVLLPIIVSSLYLIFFTIKSGGYYVDNQIAASGKTSGTRYGIWINAFSNINLIPFVSSYFASSDGMVEPFQWHNTGIDVIVAFGFVSYALLITYLFSINYFSFIRKQSDKTFGIYFGFFVAVFSLGIFEAFPFFSANGIALLSFSYLAISKVNFKGQVLCSKESYKTPQIPLQVESYLEVTI